MNLLYYRIGFASNSSSLHSTWHVGDASQIREHIEDTDFGWDHFVCSTELGIEKYLAAQLKMNLYSVPDIVVYGLIKHLFPRIKVSEIKEMNVDHQSTWSFPMDFHSHDDIFPSFKFIKDLKKYLLKTNAIIIGGNDNESMPDIRSIINYENPQPDEIINATINNYRFNMRNSVCVKDGQVWKIFDRNNGKKMRFSFVDNVEYTKSSEPELIDLIITNKCSHGCPYCYRGCTSEKKEAPLKRIQRFLYSLLNDVCVFEIAIGGGNILEYSQFYELCEFIKNVMETKRTIFNTTINCKDFIDENSEKIINLFSTFRGIAVSVSNTNDVDHVINYLNKHHVKVKKSELTFQCIPELMTYEEIVNLKEQRDQSDSFTTYGITFLGFKHTGRGNSPLYSAAEFEENKEEFRKFINDRSKLDPDDFDTWYKPDIFGIDTELIHNFPELKETQAAWLYDEHEGKFSCCVDLVDNYVLPSSYSEYKDEYKAPITTKRAYYLHEEEQIGECVEAFLEKIYPKF